MNELLELLRSAHSIAARRGDKTNWETWMSRLAIFLRRYHNFPKVICFCGSSRFVAVMAVLMWEFEKEGNISMGLHYMPPEYGESKGYVGAYNHLAEMEGIAKEMDALHKRKIDLADEVFVVNVGGYIGDSTRSEIAYAHIAQKPVRYLEPPKED